MSQTEYTNFVYLRIFKGGGRKYSFTSVAIKVSIDIYMMSIRKKSGGPDGKYYESSETIAKFESVRQWLMKNCKKVGINQNNSTWYHMLLLLFLEHTIRSSK